MKDRQSFDLTQEDVKEMTLRPKINHTSHIKDLDHQYKLFKVAKEENPNAHLREERLLHYGKSLEQRKQKEREEKDKQDMKECTFTPDIMRYDFKKDQIDSGVTKHEELYHMYKKASKKQKQLLDQKIKKECPFKPQLIAKNNSKRPEDPDQLIEELQIWGIENKARAKEVHDTEEYINQTIDNQTGQKLFKPVINPVSKEISALRHKDSNKFENLYDQKT